MTSFAMEHERGVTTITLDRPKRLNALTFEIYRELAETFEQLSSEADVRAIVITGRGRGFCSGGDQDDIIHHLLGKTTPELVAFTRATSYEKVFASITTRAPDTRPPGSRPAPRARRAR